MAGRQEAGSAVISRTCVRAASASTEPPCSRQQFSTCSVRSWARPPSCSICSGARAAFLTTSSVVLGKDCRGRLRRVSWEGKSASVQPQASPPRPHTSLRPCRPPGMAHPVGRFPVGFAQVSDHLEQEVNSRPPHSCCRGSAPFSGDCTHCLIKMRQLAVLASLVEGPLRRLACPVGHAPILGPCPE